MAADLQKFQCMQAKCSDSVVVTIRLVVCIIHYSGTAGYWGCRPGEVHGSYVAFLNWDEYKKLNIFTKPCKDDSQN